MYRTSISAVVPLPPCHWSICRFNSFLSTSASHCTPCIAVRQAFSTGAGATNGTLPCQTFSGAIATKHFLLISTLNPIQFLSDSNFQKERLLLFFQRHFQLRISSPGLCIPTRSDSDKLTQSGIFGNENSPHQAFSQASVFGWGCRPSHPSQVLIFQFLWGHTHHSFLLTFTFCKTARYRLHTVWDQKQNTKQTFHSFESRTRPYKL